VAGFNSYTCQPCPFQEARKACPRRRAPSKWMQLMEAQHIDSHLCQLIEWLWILSEVVEFEDGLRPRQLVPLKVGIQACSGRAEIWNARRNTDARTTHAHDAFDSLLLDVLCHTYIAIAIVVKLCFGGIALKDS
jgi:hypothetical protein